MILIALNGSPHRELYRICHQTRRKADDTAKNVIFDLARTEISLHAFSNLGLRSSYARVQVLSGLSLVVSSSCILFNFQVLALI